MALEPASAAATGVFRVRRKFPRDGGGGREEEHLAALRRHDVRSYGRLLGTVDLPLGGVGLPTETGLYHAQIGIGAPAKGYYAQVDTGSKILWVNCIRCDGCPSRSGLGIELTQYDPAVSGSTVACDQEFCVDNYGGVPPTCSSTSPCQFRLTYGRRELNHRVLCDRLPAVRPGVRRRSDHPGQCERHTRVWCSARWRFGILTLMGFLVSGNRICRCYPAGCCRKSEKDFCSLLGHCEWWWDLCSWECGTAESEDNAVGAQHATLQCQPESDCCWWCDAAASNKYF